MLDTGVCKLKGQFSTVVLLINKKNKTANGVLHDAVHRLHIMIFFIFRMSYGVTAHAFRGLRKSWLSLSQFSQNSEYQEQNIQISCPKFLRLY